MKFFLIFKNCFVNFSTHKDKDHIQMTKFETQFRDKVRNTNPVTNFETAIT